MIQLALFDDNYTTHYIQQGFAFKFPQISDVTFLNGLSEPVHRWFRLTPSYSPELVRFFAKELGCDNDSIVCDPFLGKGTTAIEMKKLGIPFVGIEINPLLKIAAEYALTWEVSSNQFAAHFAEVEKKLIDLLEKCQSMSIDSVMEQYKLQLPPIHNVFRWWKKDVLKELLLVKRIIEEICETTYSQLYWMALCASALDCANIHRNHPTISFDDNHTRQIDVRKDFTENVAQIVNDLRNLPPQRNFGRSQILLGDSTKISHLIDQKVNRIITSPPYPNRFSYVHTTRPQLFFMGVFDEAAQSSELDLAAIGGTWGKATSVLYDDVIRPHPHIEKILAPIIDELRPKSNLMCNYAIKYFNMMDEHIQELHKITASDFRGAYVVGNSRLKGVEILTDVLLAKMFDVAGFSVDQLLVLRKRGGKKELYETAICVSK